MISLRRIPSEAAAHAMPLLGWEVPVAGVKNRRAPVDMRDEPGFCQTFEVSVYSALSPVRYACDLQPVCKRKVEHREKGREVIVTEIR